MLLPYKPLLISLLLLTLSPLGSQAQACPTGNSSSLSYIRRNNNRCEGLRDRDISSTFELISFSTDTLGTDYPSTLNIRVPGTGRTRPAIAVQSFSRNYRLDNLTTTSSDSGYTFALNTSILKQAEVPTESLRATAYITRNSSPVFFPVVLGSSSNSYEFVINSPQRLAFPTFEIRRNNRVVFKDPRPNARSGHIRLTWEYGDAPAGSYQFYIVDENGNSRTFAFEHNPDWFN
jgi:hypothetical protein